MESDKNKKYFILGIVGIILIGLFVRINLFKSKPKEEKEKTISQEETRSMLSYTLDGEKTDIKPTKEDGYIANKIICENGSNLIWDNTNWEVEIISLESNDICTVDFTTNEGTNGYRVTATTNVEGSIDSLSKATIENGKVIFYPNKGQEITSVSGCSNGKLENNKVIVLNVTSNQTCNISVKNPSLFSVLSNGNKYIVDARNIAATSPIEGTSISQGYNSIGKIYKTGNDYYFAGNPSDNWMLFAGFWWRIIRTNSSEGTRLLYAGTTHDGQDGYINNTTYQWYSSNNSVSYVQWNYASSTIGNALNTWYSSNISSYENMVNTNVEYCNDTSVASTSGNNQWFGAFERLTTNKSPSYSCTTNSNSTHKKIGLMTADEVAFAGGVSGYNAPNTYYYRNSVSSGCTGSSGDICSVTNSNNWWTMSPYYFVSTSRVFVVYAPEEMSDVISQATGYSGRLNLCIINAKNAVRPVITLKPEVLVSGSGTTDDPYVPSLTN